MYVPGCVRVHYAAEALAVGSTITFDAVLENTETGDVRELAMDQTLATSGEIEIEGTPARMFPGEVVVVVTFSDGNIATSEPFTLMTMGGDTWQATQCAAL